MGELFKLAGLYRLGYLGIGEALICPILDEGHKANILGGEGPGLAWAWAGAFAEVGGQLWAVCVVANAGDGNARHFRYLLG